MAMGQQEDRQGDLMVGWPEMPRSPGHVFYDRLQSVLIEGGFDGFWSRRAMTARCLWRRPSSGPRTGQRSRIAKAGRRGVGWLIASPAWPA